MNYEQTLNRISEEYERILGDNLSGIYVHGSIAFRCFNPNKSDIDFITVVNRVPTLSEKSALIRVLLDLSSDAPAKGFEMSVVLAEVCKSFSYPTPFVLHYSNAYRQACMENTNEYCKSMNGTDKDLAAHFTVIKSVGYALVGEPISEAFGDVPPECYWDSIRRDVASAKDDVADDPIYVVLNLCRALAYKTDNLILSKAGGGVWGAEHLPKQYRRLIGKALTAYKSDSEESFDLKLSEDFCDYMLNRIL